MDFLPSLPSRVLQFVTLRSARLSELLRMKWSSASTERWLSIQQQEEPSPKYQGKKNVPEKVTEGREM